MNLTKRELVMPIVLAFVTCGLYTMYWAFCMGREIAQANGDGDGLVDGLLCALLPFIGFYLIEKKFAAVCATNGIAHEDRSIIYLILGLFLAIGCPIMMQLDINNLA